MCYFLMTESEPAEGRRRHFEPAGKSCMDGSGAEVPVSCGRGQAAAMEYACGRA